MNEKFEHLIERADALLARIESILPQPLSAPDWGVTIAWRYRKRSSGHGALEPVRHVAAMRLGDLKEIDVQKEKIQRNTLQFVQGQPANNVLLTGARGTGKSSLIKACLNEYAADGLRLIEVDIHPGRLGGGRHAQCADLCHQQPPTPAARVHEGKPHLYPHGRW